MKAKYLQPSPYSYFEIDLNAKTEPKSPRACDADAHGGVIA